MDYFQGVVFEYLRTDLSCFLNSEYYLRNDLSEKDEAKKKHWFVDILALHNRHKCVYLCEVTYAKEPRALLNRLKLWREHWDTVKETLVRDACVPRDWPVRPWVFVPEARLPVLKPLLPVFDPGIRISSLEDTLPWNYVWNNSLAEPA